MGAWSAQDLPGGDAAEGKGEEKWGEVPVRGSPLRVSVFRGARRGGACCGKLAFCVWCRQSAVLFFGVWRPVFPAPFTEGNVLSLVYVLGSFLVNQLITHL